MRILVIPAAVLFVGATPPPAPRVPVVRCNSAGHVIPSHKIIVQGGIAPKPVSGTSMVAIGPKQDDPVRKPTGEPAMSNVRGAGDPAALGPKQDDPGPPPSPDITACQKAPRG